MHHDFGNPLPATPKQIAYARSLAARNHVVLPWEVQQDRKAMSDWIDQQASQKPSMNDLPSSRQVQFAERIARMKRRQIPDECFRSRSLLSGWINSNR
ncbi:hypothetical protein EU803_15880 [Loktanella sp. IMCC34160]|uniref:hypothetical protein n=1 Tax=Loktanella sp. IMCC34160 TaxID=2510646 RepID=UPI00101B9EEE|nr:hypothetical protein [Loktanella sp. IMCC34160]RYG90090.1 hypothetical protein EU803_15880 [Loktanella sp. IMCC34160]